MCAFSKDDSNSVSHLAFSQCDQEMESWTGLAGDSWLSRSKSETTLLPKPNRKRQRLPCSLYHAHLGVVHLVHTCTMYTLGLCYTEAAMLGGRGQPHREATRRPSRRQVGHQSIPGVRHVSQGDLRWFRALAVQSPPQMWCEMCWSKANLTFPDSWHKHSKTTLALCQKFTMVCNAAITTNT